MIRKDAMRLHAVKFLLLGGMIASLPALGAQTPAANSSQTPTFKTNARAVVVDVVVTKGNDEPVPALHKQELPDY